MKPVPGLRIPWTTVARPADLGETFRSMTTRVSRDEPSRAPIPNTGDLSLVEVPASGVSPRDLFAIVLSGDGGWAELDKSVAAGLAARGLPVVGWSSLRYFWSPKTPEQASADLSRIVSHYAVAWNRPRVVLVGYSFGADVLPFLVTRLPADVRGRIATLALLGLSPAASFEFHIADWFGGAKPTTYQTAPEVARLSLPIVCVQGAGESDSGCPSLTGPHVTTVTVGAGHHFGAEYRRLVDVILSGVSGRIE